MHRIIHSHKITHRSRSNLDVEHVALVAHFRYLRPRKSVHVQSIVVNVKSIRTNSDVDVNQLRILRNEALKILLKKTRSPTNCM